MKIVSRQWAIFGLVVLLVFFGATAGMHELGSDVNHSFTEISATLDDQLKTSESGQTESGPGSGIRYGTASLPAAEHGNRAGAGVGKAAPRTHNSTEDIAGTKLGSEINAAVLKAKKGKIAYKIPTTMKEGHPETVTVRISGPHEDASQQSSFQSTGNDTLKVLPQMVVTLTEPANPDAFEITDQPGINKGTQLVPENSHAEWDFTVKPLSGRAAPETLHIAAYMVFATTLATGEPVRVQIGSYDAEVKVSVKPRIEKVEDWMKEHPETVLEYTLPSGCGAAILTAFSVWIRKKKKQTNGSKEETDKKANEPESGDDD